MNTSIKTSTVGFQFGSLQGSALEWRLNERLAQVPMGVKFYDLFNRTFNNYEHVWIAHNEMNNTYNLTSRVEEMSLMFNSFEEAERHVAAVFVARRMGRS